MKLDTLLIIYTIFESQSLKKKYDRGEIEVKPSKLIFFRKIKIISWEF